MSGHVTARSCHATPRLAHNGTSRTDRISSEARPSEVADGTHGRDSWGFACPPTAQPILRFFDPMDPKGGTDQKLAVLLGGKHVFFPESSLLVKYVTVFAIFGAQWPRQGLKASHSRAKVPVASVLNRINKPKVTTKLPGAGVGHTLARSAQSVHRDGPYCMGFRPF